MKASLKHDHIIIRIKGHKEKIYGISANGYCWEYGFEENLQGQQGKLSFKKMESLDNIPIDFVSAIILDSHNEYLSKLDVNTEGN